MAYGVLVALRSRLYRIECPIRHPQRHRPQVVIVPRLLAQDDFLLGGVVRSRYLNGLERDLIGADDSPDGDLQKKKSRVVRGLGIAFHLRELISFSGGGVKHYFSLGIFAKLSAQANVVRN